MENISDMRTRSPQAPLWWGVMKAKINHDFLKKRVRMRLAEYGENQAEFCARTGVNRSALSEWMNGNKTPDVASLQKLADALGKPLGYLLDDGEQKNGTSSEEAWRMATKWKSKDFDASTAQPLGERHFLQERDERVAADHQPVTNIPLMSEAVPVDVKYNRANHWTMKVTGLSMYPTMFEGDRIIIEKFLKELPTFDNEDERVDPAPWLKLHGEVVLVQIDNDETDTKIKRMEVQKTKRGFKIILRSDNPKSTSIPIDRSTPIRVVGIVREIMRNPKNV